MTTLEIIGLVVVGVVVVLLVVTSLGSDPVYGFRGLLGCCPTLD